MSTKIINIESKAERLRFVKSMWNFYKDDKNFVPPIIVDRMKLIDTNKNAFYQHAKIKLFAAERDGEIVGRIAGITNELHNQIHNDKVGFFGFFECENNQETANMLFDSASQWLREQGMDVIRGPLNPSINDELGLLIENFDEPPMILMTYNPPYYRDLIEEYGFLKAKDLYAYRLNYKDFASEKLKRMVGIITERNQITFRNVDFKKNFKHDVALIKEIYNRAWQPNWGFVKLTDAELDQLANDLKQLAEPSLAFFAYVKGQLAGFHLALPNFNQVFIHNKNGSLLGALWQIFTKKKTISQLRIIILGVLPEFQRTGVDAAIYEQSGYRGHLKNMEDAEASWILEDNEMMNKGLTVTMNGKLYKVYRIFDKQL
ncbi:MAG TPA: hypothetical protein PLE30_09565 [Candidatus Kapabacteria bacterium]|nr:hypothetical protein [Candidatus Kapabacteria bacterium]